MNANEFVGALKQVAYRAAVAGTLGSLRRPPGRRPDQSLVQLSGWFNGLSSHDQEQVTKSMEMAASQALYNVLLVFDGLLAIQSEEEKGELHVVFVDRHTRSRLNEPGAPQLTDLFKDAD